MTHIRKNEYYVTNAAGHAAKQLVRLYHYTQSCSHMFSFCHGLYTLDHTLKGAALWLPPMRPAAARLNRAEPKRVLSLSRFVITPDMPTNAASFLLGRSIRLIRATGLYTHLLTFADEAQQHEGTIYKATNWKQDGYSAYTDIWQDQYGKHVAKQSTYSRTDHEMRKLGYIRVGKSRKKRFVYEFT